MTNIAQPHPSDPGLSENAITGLTCDISVVNGNGAIVSRNSIFNYQLGGEFWGRIEGNSFFRRHYPYSAPRHFRPGQYRTR